jgi:hypothetical protein
MAVLMYQRTMVRMTIDPDWPASQQAPKVVRHLLDPRDGTRALCHYRPDPGDIVNRSAGIGYYADATSDICDECKKRSEEQAENQQP